MPFAACLSCGIGVRMLLAVDTATVCIGGQWAHERSGSVLVSDMLIFTLHKQYRCFLRGFTVYQLSFCERFTY